MIHKIRAVTAAFYYGFPARKMRVVGVAGTKGKTTTTNLVAHILEKFGSKVVMFSTANMRVAGAEFPNTEKLTTPSPFFMQKFLSDALDKGCNYAVIEVSSHALVQNRLYSIDFDKIIITNLMPDHLDYHKDADEYRDIHLKMIGPKSETVIINKDENQAQILRQKIQDIFPKIKVLEFGSGENSDLTYYDVQLNSGSVKFRAELFKKQTGEFILNIPGRFSVYNALAAIMFAISENIDIEKIKKALAAVKSVPGRLESIKVSEAQDFSVIVDYAHSPDSLLAVYEAVRPAAKKRLIAVLGGTGDRDKTYRAKAGALADRFADTVVVTNEDPYSESPESIMDQVLNGIKNKKMGENLFRILDRREAIRKAVNIAKKDDIILITGKGSEQFMIWGDKRIPWDDRIVSRDALNERFIVKK